MKEYYDAIVVGAGPGGSSAAYHMAQQGLNVALFEKGNKPGDKNVYGGTIYRRSTQEAFPGFWEEAPLERTVITDEVWFLEHDSAVKMGFTGLEFKKPPYNKFTALRSKFDNWLAEQAKDVGAELYTNTLVTDLLYQKGFLASGKRIKGVKLYDGTQIKAGVVILAEGVNAPLAHQAGLRKKLPTNAFTLYTCETLALSPKTIEERFELESGEGATIGFAGFPTSGSSGKGGLWTNHDNLSIIVGGRLNEMVSKQLNPHHMLERFKSHPLIKRLLHGADSLEYKAYMIPKGGYSLMPKLFSDGVLIVGDAAIMISGRRGTDLAMISGKKAAETVVQAKAREDFSKKSLANYSHKLNQQFFMKDIKSKTKEKDYYLKHPDADYLVNSLMNEIAYEFFTEDLKEQNEKQKLLFSKVYQKQLPIKSFVDLIQGINHWRFG